MSVGDAQRYEIRMNDLPQYKIYHYEKGTSNAKAIWSDAGKTTPLAQPFIADSNGNATFFADGLYRLKFHDSSDVPISGMDYDDFEITADKSTTFELNQGTVLPSASAANKGHVFLLFDVSSNILGIYRSDGTQYKATAEFTATGDQIFDSVITKTMPVYNVLHSDWGAVGDGVTDDTAAIQAAVDAVPAAGGVIYFPEGKYVFTSKLTITNKNITFKGDGEGVSILIWAASGGIDYDSTNVRDHLLIEDLSIQTDFAGAGDAINANWPTAGLTRENCNIRNVEIGPTPAAASTAYFTNGIVLSDSQNCELDNIVILGKANDVTAMVSGIHFTDDCRRARVTKCNIQFATNGVLLEGVCDRTNIVDNTLTYVNKGIVYNFGDTEPGHTASLNNIQAFLYGINTVKTVESILSKNTITKHPDSTEDFRGCLIDANSNKISLLGNSIRGAGTSGTDVGITMAGSNCSIWNNDIEDQNIGINCISGGDDNYITGNRSENNTTNYQDAGTGNRWALDNYTSGVQTVVAAATMTLPPVGGMFHVIDDAGSPINIATITASWFGRVVTLYVPVGGADANVIKDATGNIYLVGASTDFGLGEKDTLTLICDGTNWHEVSQATL